MAKITNPHNNSDKQNAILEIYYKACGLENPQKVNLSRNAEVKDAKIAGKKEFIELSKDKEIPLVFEQPIVVGEESDVHIVPLANCHFFDLSNPNKGICDFTNFVALKETLSDKRPQDRNVILVNGGLAGTGYDIKNFNTAAIKNGKILAWGLKLIEDETAKMILYAACYGDNPVIILQYGREERRVTERLNVLFYKRVLEKIKRSPLWKKLETKPEIYLAGGTKRVYNIEKKLQSGETLYFDFSNHTNLKSNSDTVSANFRSAQQQHGGLASADVTIIQTENVPYAVVDDDSNVVMCGGQSTYKRTSKGTVPMFTSDGSPAFNILLGDRSHNVEIMRSTSFVNDRTIALERRNAYEDKKLEFLTSLCAKKINEKYASFVNDDLDMDYKGQVISIEKGENYGK